MGTKTILVSEEGLGISERALDNCNALYQTELSNAGYFAEIGNVSGALRHLYKAQDLAQRMLLGVPEETGKKTIISAYENAFNKTLEGATKLRESGEIEVSKQLLGELDYLAKNFPGNKLRRGALIKKVENANKELSTPFEKYASEAQAVKESK